MSYPPEFQTKRLILKAVTEADIPSYEKYFIDYEVIRHLSSVVPWPYPGDGVSHHIKTCILPKQGDNKWVWGIYLRQETKELIGVVDLWRPGKPENRGFWLGHQFWGYGYMTEAVIPVTDFAFDILGFNKLIFSNAVGNLRSRRIKEKTGARVIGVEPASFVDPIYREREIWELSCDSWHVSRKETQIESPWPKPNQSFNPVAAYTGSSHLLLL